MPNSGIGTAAESLTAVPIILDGYSDGDAHYDMVMATLAGALSVNTGPAPRTLRGSIEIRKYDGQSIDVQDLADIWNYAGPIYIKDHLGTTHKVVPITSWAVQWLRGDALFGRMDFEVEEVLG